MNPKDDPTSVGLILIKMGVITKEDLVAAIDEQDNSSIEYLLGKLLVANGVCSKEQVEIALAAQQGMRSNEDHKKAVAIASIATARKKMMRQAGQHMIERTDALAIKTGSDIYPVVVMKMNLVGGGKKGSDSGNGAGA